MEPTVFCIIVPLALNICSAPVDFDPLFHLRQERSITLNTGNDSGIAEGKIVNTAQTDKQLIINIETKVLPQFNVYLDSLQQSPRMQCTTKDEQGEGTTKKRVFTCISMSNMCCPSTTTCICSETNQPTAVSTIVPDLNNCKELCGQCMTTAIVPTYFVPTTSTSATDNCPELCSQCMVTAIIPTYFVPTTSNSATDNCPELCMQCMATTTLLPTNIVRTTCFTVPNNCPQLCKQCMANTMVPAVIVRSTSAPAPFNCPELCRQCNRIIPNPKPTELIPHSLQCTELCKQCQTTEPKLSPLNECLSDCQASCHKKYPTPFPEKCDELCKQCQPAKIIEQSETKCISCNTLCAMCKRVKFPHRQKRELSLESDRFRPLIINIDGVDSKDASYKINIEGCQTTKCSQKHYSPTTYDLVISKFF
ncbi:uncharacterized protein LOC124355740 [Homalodisca vitripennis]|nr:uncharacterized protein LOC124355740 [Homalodisca vitripennis]